MINDIALRQKRDKQQEYTVHLFEYCNLSCSFCWQDHNKVQGIDTVLEKLAPIEQFLQAEKNKRVVFNIMGGEIFADQIYDETLNDTYILLAKGIVNLGKKYNIEVGINWVTNLVTDKISQIERLLVETRRFDIKSSLVTSYDPAGRFNRNTFPIFKKNLYYFKNDVEGIGLLLTKPNIRYWLKMKESFLNEIYRDGFYLYADYYMPDESAKMQAPADTDLYSIFRHFIDNFPNIDPIRSWIENEFNYITCRTSKLILQDGTMCLCGNLVQEPKDKVMYVSFIQKADNSAIENRFLEKYNCLSCEYFKRCGLGCFMQHDYKFRDELDECVYKLTHRYIDDVRIQQRRQPVELADLSL